MNEFRLLASAETKHRTHDTRHTTHDAHTRWCSPHTRHKAEADERKCGIRGMKDARQATSHCVELKGTDGPVSSKARRRPSNRRVRAVSQRAGGRAGEKGRTGCHSRELKEPAAASQRRRHRTAHREAVQLQPDCRRSRPLVSRACKRWRWGVRPTNRCRRDPPAGARPTRRRENPPRVRG
jgi:hypothetical protein